LAYGEGKVNIASVLQFEQTPKAFANSSPRLERSDNLGNTFASFLKP